MPTKNVPINIFYYYCSKDRPLGRQLTAQLSILERRGEITPWHNGLLQPGENIHKATISKIESADIILLLVSADFLDCEMCPLIEKSAGLRLAQKSKPVRVIPVILRPCDWQAVEFIRPFNSLPKSQDGMAKAVTTWVNVDEAFAQVSREIRKLSSSIRRERWQNKQRNIAAYENALYHAINQERPLRAATRKKLTRLQEMLGLEDDDVTFSRTFVGSKVTDDLIDAERYRQEVRLNIWEDRGEITPTSRIILDQKRTSLGLSPQAAKAIEDEELMRPQKYERVFSAIYSIEYYLGDSAKHRLMMIAAKLNLDQSGLFEDIQNRILERIKINSEDIKALLKSNAIPRDLLEERPHGVAESEIGIDYSRLRLALEAQNWKAADQETWHILTEFAGKNRWSRKIPPERLLDFPSLDIKTIDDLWGTYSDHQFGFSTQTKIYQDCGAILNGNFDPALWQTFGEKVGWANKRHWLYYFELNFDLTAPKGHLPGKIFSVVEGPLLLQIAYIAHVEFRS